MFCMGPSSHSCPVLSKLGNCDIAGGSCMHVTIQMYSYGTSSQTDYSWLIKSMTTEEHIFNYFSIYIGPQPPFV